MALVVLASSGYAKVPATGNTKRGDPAGKKDMLSYCYIE